MAKDLFDLSKFKKIFSDGEKTHLQHPKGHTIVVAHIALSPKVKEQLDKLPMHDPKEMMEHALENAEHMVKHLAEGGEAKPSVNRLNMHYKDVTKRVPELTEAAKQVAAGKMSPMEYDALVNEHKPVKGYDFVPEPASAEDAMRALNEAKRKRYGLTHEIPHGEQTDLRLDIPAYKEHGVWVNSIHRKDAPTTYGSVSSVRNATMIGAPHKALKVASGEATKSPFAVIRGEWNPIKEHEAVEKAQKYLKHKEWRQVGYDPERHGYFYDRETMEPIEGAEEVIQIGPLVLAKNPKFGEKHEQMFAQGGRTSRYDMSYGQKKRQVRSQLAREEEERQIAEGKLPSHEEREKEFQEKMKMALADLMAAKKAQGYAEGGETKPFHGYNPEKHARTGGLNDSYREKYNREHGSHLKRPVTGHPAAGSEAAGRKKSFCARMKGVKGATSEGGELTPKGAALKRWNCHAHGGAIHDDHDEECEHYAKGGRTSALLDKKGRKINKRSERERIFGDDANASRLSDERMKMMLALRDKVKDEYGVGLRTAAGKRTETGEIRDKDVQPPFDVYTPEGHEAERAYVAEQKAINPKFKRIDPKPDWDNPDKYMDTQPNPDAGVHEVAHARQIPIGMTLAEHQNMMDRLQGQVQKDYGFLQNKRTSHEIQPMAMENSIRRELGFPANSSIATGTAHDYVENPETLAKHNAGRMSRGQPALETNEEGIPLTHDTKEPMYVAGRDHKGNVVYFMRQSRLMSPENRQRTEDMRQKTVKYHPERGMVESVSPHALINLRGQGRHAEAEHRLRTRGENRFADGGEVHYYPDGGEVDENDGQDAYRAPASEPMPAEEPLFEPSKPVQATQMPDYMQPTQASQKPPEPAPEANQWEQKFNQYRKEADKLSDSWAHPSKDSFFGSATTAPASMHLPTTNEQKEQWALNKTLEEKKAYDQQQAMYKEKQVARENEQQKLLKDIEEKKKLLGMPASVGYRGPAAGAQPAGTGMTKEQEDQLPAFQRKVAPTGADNMDIYNSMMRGMKQEIGGIYKQAAAAGDIARAQAIDYERNISEQRANQALYEKHYKELENERNNLVDDYYNEQIDPMMAWNDKSVPAKISSAIGLILGGIGGGLTRQENPAMKFLQYQIDKAVEGQKMKLGREQNLLSANLNQFKNIKDAADFTRATLAEIVAKQIMMDAAKSGDQMAQGLAQEKAGALLNKNVVGPMARLQFVNSIRDPNATPEMQAQTIKLMEQYMPEEARYWRNQFHPVYGVPEHEMPESDKQQLMGLSNFRSRAKKLLSLIDQYGPEYFPGEYKEILNSVAEDLLMDLKTANRTDLTEGTLKGLKDQIGDATGAWNYFVKNNAALKTTMDALATRQEHILANSYGKEKARSLMQRENFHRPQEMGTIDRSGAKYPSGRSYHIGR